MIDEDIDVGLGNAMFWVEYIILKKDLELLRRENIKFFSRLIPDSVRWRKVDGFKAAINILAMAIEGNAEAEWLTYHLCRQEIAGFEKFFRKDKRLSLLKSSARKGFAPALFEASFVFFPVATLARPSSINAETSEQIESILSSAAFMGSMDAYHFYYVISNSGGFITPQSMTAEEALVGAASRGHPDALAALVKLRIKQNRIAEAHFYSMQISSSIPGYNNFIINCRVTPNQAEALTNFCQERCSSEDVLANFEKTNANRNLSFEEFRDSLDDSIFRNLFHVGDPLYEY